MTELRHFSENLERIGLERMASLGERARDSFDCPPDLGFRHRDFEIQFRDADDLERSLGRQSLNRLTQLAGLVGYYGGFCRNYLDSGKAEAPFPQGEEERPSAELFKDMNSPSSPSSETPRIPPLVVKVGFRLDFREKPSVVYIPQTSRVLLSIYRTREAVRRAVRYAQECGLVQCVDASYRFGPKSPRAKRYAWNKVCERQLRDLMKRRGVLVPSSFGASEVPPAAEPEAPRGDQHLYYKVRLGKGMRTPGLAEEDVSRILSWKHRFVLGPMLDRIAFVNEGRPEAERLRFRFSVRITNGYNVKNGCRAFSLAGGLPKASKAAPGELSFEEYFRNAYGDEPAEYDVKGSVPRINRLAGRGVWDGPGVDPYSEMFPGFCADALKRKIAKSTYMLYEFEESGPRIRADVARRCPEFAAAEGVGEIGQTMEYWYGGVRKWQGDSLGSLAFLYEDAAYSCVDAELKRLGYDFVRKFDCWVFPRGRTPAEEEFWALVRDRVLEWRRTEYEEERAELEFLEGAGVRELRRHVFQDARQGNTI